MYPIFKGVIKSGKILPDQENDFAGYLKTLEGKEIDIIVRKQTLPRTVPQNRLYRAYVALIAKEIGYDPGELHNTLKKQYLPRPLKSTTELNTTQFTEYVNRIIREMAELNIILPEAGDIEI